MQYKILNWLRGISLVIAIFSLMLVGTNQKLNSAPPYLSTCSFDGSGNVTGFTCSYVFRLDPCSPASCTLSGNQ